MGRIGTLIEILAILAMLAFVLTLRDVVGLLVNLL